jgi:hypothetical protein
MITYFIKIFNPIEINIKISKSYTYLNSLIKFGFKIIKNHKPNLWYSIKKLRIKKATHNYYKLYDEGNFTLTYKNIIIQ